MRRGKEDLKKEFKKASRKARKSLERLAKAENPITAALIKKMGL